MITGQITGDEQLIEAFRAMPTDVRQSVARRVLRLSIVLQRHVKERKLSGQVLRNRTGRLRRSITREVTEQPTAIIAKVGTNVSYARIHEYGGVVRAHDVYPKHAKALSFIWHGKRVFFARVHIPQIKMPERSFLRSSLRELRGQITSELKAEVHGALKSTLSRQAAALRKG